MRKDLNKMEHLEVLAVGSKFYASDVNKYMVCKNKYPTVINIYTDECFQNFEKTIKCNSNWFNSFKNKFYNMGSVSIIRIKLNQAAQRQ
jgi:hypothetical protein